jgi:dTDP-4-dehydrorhamnose reductase
MKNKVLILGSKGTLGQALVARFQTGFEITAWDREECDVTAPDIGIKIKAIKPYIIINATAYNAVDKAESDPAEKQLAFLLNARVPENLAKISAEINAVLVHYSTDNVFKGDSKAGYRESDQPAPVNVYGESKFTGEQAVIKFAPKYYLIRLSRLFGVKGVSSASKKSFVEIMLEKKSDPTLTVMNVEIASPTFAPDLAELTADLILKKMPWGIYHGTNSGACTWFEWATEIFKQVGNGPQLTPVYAPQSPRPAKRPEFSQLLNTKLPPQRSWQDALADFLKS